MFHGIGPAQTPDGERSGGGRFVCRRDELVDIDEGTIDRPWMVDRPPYEFRKMRNLHLSAGHVRQLSELPVKFCGRHSTCGNDDNPPRIGVANPRCEVEVRPYKNKSATSWELEALRDGLSYR